MLRSDAARLLPDKAREIIRRAEQAFDEVCDEIRQETPKRKVDDVVRR